VESALVSAARKSLGLKETAGLKVEINPNTGEIKVFQDDKEVTSVDFGRIAAQTAKQVIIQKIREAEKDVVFSEFQHKQEDIVGGTVYRFEKGGVIVDLGKAEGFLPRSEQPQKEILRQGERIKAYILEVKKEGRGPQIILSRKHPNFVKRLFEIEVPEIYEGIVEIKSVAREAGERTKIAVWSKDEKVDCVGACVGMRGTRVRNIVNEMQGEKIDIVRWNKDPKDYIAAALSPAEISSIELDKDKNKAQVIVKDDQLSLAIGKKGQNVRLACKLTGWDIDIRTAKDEKKEKEAKKEAPEVKKEKPAEKETGLETLKGVGPKTLKSLQDAGINSLSKLAEAKLEEITKIKGIGEKKAQGLIDQAKELLKGKA
jgi:N utilization substance protein A